MRPYAFVCHAPEDRAAADALCGLLTRCGLRLRRRGGTAEGGPEGSPSGAAVLLALTSPAAERDGGCETDIRYMLGRGGEAICLSLSPNGLDRLFCFDGGALRVPFRPEDCADGTAVLPLVHRLLIRCLSRRPDCFDPLAAPPDGGPEPPYVRAAALAVRARAGDAAAAYELGLCYERGRGVPSDEGEAAYWTGLAAEGGHPDARIRLGERLLHGQGVGRDPEAALRLFRTAAEAGDPRGDYYRGLCCLRGEGAARDPETAARRLRAAAEGGCLPASYRLALLDRDGEGTRRDFGRAAARLYAVCAAGAPPSLPGGGVYGRGRRAGEGSARPAYRAITMRGLRRGALGRLLREGAGARRPFARCRAVPRSGNVWLPAETRAEGDGPSVPGPAWGRAERARAALVLGAILESGGPGLRPAPTRALVWYRYAADLGDAEALFRLGNAFRRGSGAPADRAYALRLFLLASERGCARADFACGVCFEEGIGAERNLPEAVRFYERAVRAGYPPAMVNLGGCRADGRGTVRDERAAAELYAQAEGRGSPEGACRLALCYETGRGVAADRAKALQLYRKAAGQGVPYAAYRLAICLERGVREAGTPPDDAAAVRLYREAALRTPEAAYALSLRFRDGRGAPRDGAERIRLLEAAAASGQIQALSELGAVYAEGGAAGRNPQRAEACLTEAVRRFRTGRGTGDGGGPLPLGALTEAEAAGDALFRLGRRALYRPERPGGPERTAEPPPDAPAVLEAEALLREAAELGHVAALTALGDLYAYGFRTVRDERTSAKAEGRAFYRRAAREALARRRAGRARPEDDPADALLSLYEQLTRKADSLPEGDARRGPLYGKAWTCLSLCEGWGSADVCVARAACLWLGRGVAADPAAARDLLRTAERLDRGHASASLWLGDLCLDGRLGPPDPEAADRAYLRAVTVKGAGDEREAGAAGTAPAGAGRALEARLARRRAAALEARAAAFLRLAALRATGLLGEGRSEQAFLFLAEAVLAGQPDALDDLARMIEQTPRGTSPAEMTADYYAALRPIPVPFAYGFRYGAGGAPRAPAPAADAARVDALLYLGERLYAGNGLPRDAAAAAACFRGAAGPSPAGGAPSEGRARAQYRYGLCLLRGEGVRQDPQEAVRRLAAAAGSSGEAACALGEAYEGGFGTEAADDRCMEALRYYRKAVRLGYAPAAARAEALRRRLGAALRE